MDRVVHWISAVWFRLSLTLEAVGRWTNTLAVRYRRRAGRIFAGTQNERLYLDRNRDLLGCHRDSACVIIGSGPTLANVDLAHLSSFVTISVNETFIYLRDHGGRADYHVLIDQDYFSGAPRMDDMLRDIGTFAKQTGGTLILDAAGLVALRDRRLVGDLPIHGLRQVGRLGDYAAAGVTPSLKLDDAVPEFAVVTQAAIAVALAMGCPQIYLVGHDFDYYRDLDQPTPHVYGHSLYYDDHPSPLESHGGDFHALMATNTDRISGFALLNRIAQNQNQKIFNTSPQSALHVFRYRPLP